MKDLFKVYIYRLRLKGKEEINSPEILRENSWFGSLYIFGSPTACLVICLINSYQKFKLCQKIKDFTNKGI